jgi:lipopolysaccharide transport system permease protein
MSSVGPSINFRQIRTLTSASIRSRYRGSWAGLLWVVISPVTMFAAQAYAFKYVLKVQVPGYALYLLTGLLPWIFLSQSISMSTTLFTTNARLFKSFPIHPVSALAAVVADNVINFLLATVVLLIGFSAFTSEALPAHIMLLPLPLFLVFLATLGLALLLATLQVFFADTKFVFDFAIAIAFYVTPIFYPIEFVDEKYRWIIEYNPFAVLLRPSQALSRAELSPDFNVWVLQALGVALVFLGIGLFAWRRKQNQLYFRL